MPSGDGFQYCQFSTTRDSKQRPDLKLTLDSNCSNHFETASLSLSPLPIAASERACKNVAPRDMFSDICPSVALTHSPPDGRAAGLPGGEPRIIFPFVTAALVSRFHKEVETPRVLLFAGCALWLSLLESPSSDRADMILRNKVSAHP